MNRADVVAQVRDFLTEELSVPAEGIELCADLRDDLGLDSLDLVELITVLEDRVGQRVDQDSLIDVRTVGDVAELVAALSLEPRAAV